METAALAIRSISQRPASAGPAHAHRRAAATVSRRRRAPCGRLRALPPELSEILSPKLVPGSPAHGNFLTPTVLICACSALMLLFYFVSNWVVPEIVMKQLQPKAEDEEASAAAASMSFSGDATDGQTGGDASRPNIRLKVKKKKKKNRKAPMEV
ncbi:hypothetical protein BAE44_0015708 [Dichanthelium oligosanthes]|uniref:Uncharacterized protein n=1 Tax=Dichanthelium oligosanthes TaxID=888268 RepID=A0A1E5VDP6_9POAL|nr:hypothetical protein BAE44_0015708 [Dichanthelium oligosanthes]